MGTNPERNDTMAKKNTAAVRKNTKGMPRITAKVCAMTKEQREAWFTAATANCTAEQKGEVRARLDQVNAGSYKLTQGQGQGRKVDFAKAFGRCNMVELLALRDTLKTAIDGKRADAAAEIEQAEKELADRKAALATA